MANIILPQTKVLDTISDNATMLVEENGEIRRYNVTSLTEDFVSQVDNKPKAGFIYPLATPTVPEGFLLCDGTAYSRTEYSELFAAIGTIYGSGDGSTTFNIPNLATRVPVGKGSGYELGAIGGEAEHTLDTSEIPNVTGQLQFRLVNNTNIVSTYPDLHQDGCFTMTQNGGVKWNSQISTTSTATKNTDLITFDNGGQNQPHNNMQPYTVINYIIATGKNTGVSVQDIITGAQALPLGVEYGGTGATNAVTARRNLGIKKVARNLLDNSDFRNPVNQRGQTAYTMGDTSYAYSIDRWKGRSGTLALNDGYVNWKTTKDAKYKRIRQVTPYVLETGHTYTLAMFARINEISGYNYLRFSTSSGTGISGAQVLLSKNDGFTWFVACCTPAETYENFICEMLTYTTATDYIDIDIKAMCLYEGEYTAETLPEYQPKGYAAELMECMRYFEKSYFLGTFSSVIYDGTKCFTGIEFRVPKRVKPTITLTNQSSDGWYSPSDFNVYTQYVEETWANIYTDNTDLSNKAFRVMAEVSADL